MDIFYDLRAEGNIGDFDEAMELIHTVWGKVNPECIFSEEAPLANAPEELNLPHITYDLVHRQHTDKLSDGKKPRQMRVYPDPDQVGHNLTEVSEWFDCQAQFIVFGNTKKEAKKWAKTFEEFILTYTGYFKQKGIAEILFREEAAPEVSSEYRQDLPHRRLRYLVKIQRNKVLRSIRLDELDVIAQTPQSDDTTDNPVVYSTNKNNEFLSLFEQTK